MADATSALASAPALRERGARALVALALGLVGFVVTAQFRATTGVTAQLEGESEQDLTRIFSSLNDESTALRDEIAQLRLELAALESSAEREVLAREAASRRLVELQVLAGAVPVAGPGVNVVVADPRDQLGFELLLDVVQELRDAGAEAIGVNGRRVGAATWFASRRGVVTVDGKELREPFVVVAIGDPATLEVGLRIPGGAVDTLAALTGVDVEVERRGEVRLPALERPPTFREADPVE